jgi:hypothetical protein
LILLALPGFAFRFGDILGIFWGYFKREPDQPTPVLLQQKRADPKADPLI